MADTSKIAQWHDEIQMRLPHLTRPQAKRLAYWSYGMMIAQSCSLTKVVVLLASVLGCTQNSLRQCLREWYLDADDKKGSGSQHKGVKRSEIVVQSCFAPLMAWVLSLWQAPNRDLALALDATTLSTRFTVLTLSVLVRRSAIPVAWYVMKAHRKGEWTSQWEALLQSVKPAIGAEWKVIVLTDRGMYSPTLFRSIVALGWHPFMRASELLSILPTDHMGQGGSRNIKTILPEQGMRWEDEVFCGASELLRCRLLGLWQHGYVERWFIVTDLGAGEALIAWYGMRFWIESGFKQQKRGGWQWHMTQMKDPVRASRMWLAMNVASLWAISTGVHLEVQAEEQCAQRAAAAQVRKPQVQLETAGEASAPPRKKVGRQQSCFTRGRLFLLTTLYQNQQWPQGILKAEPWPSEPPPPRRSLTPRQKEDQRREASRRERERKAGQRKEKRRKEKRLKEKVQVATACPRMDESPKNLPR